MESYDAIAIGSGLGGLTAAALYAVAGHRVLVLERNPSIGGAASVYRHGLLDIEASLHEIDGLGAASADQPFLRPLGLHRDLEFVPVGDLHEVRTPLLDRPFVLPHGIAAARAATIERFPYHEGAIDAFYDRLQAVQDSIGLAGAHHDDRAWWLWHAPALPWLLWPLIRDRRASLAETLDRLFGDDESIKLALAPNLPYYGDDPATLPFLAYAVPQSSYLMGGGHYVRGGSRALAQALARRVTAAGGTVATDRTVTHVLLEAGMAAGVRHRGAEGDSEAVYAPVLFGNAAPATLAAMLPEGRDDFMARYAGRRPSISLWTVALGIDRPSSSFGLRHYSTVIMPPWHRTLQHWTQAAALLGDDPGPHLPGYVVCATDQIDTGLNQDGLRLLTLTGVDRLSNWSGLAPQEAHARKQRWLEALIADLDRHCPGIAGAVRQGEMSTAATMRSWLNTPHGEVYGFAPDFHAAMPSAETAVPGLFLANAYTMSGGFTGAMLGGAVAAREAAKLR
jgi:all-trans-retinol 13,14-reductase